MIEVATLRRLRSLLAAVAVALSTACGGQSGSPTAPTQSPSDSGGSTSPATPNVGAPPAVLVGAGDIAMCGPNLQKAFATSSLLDVIDGTVFTAGDNTQASGSMDDLIQCYATTWGRHRHRTFPSPGNHDYEPANGAPYHSYFGAQAGMVGLGYYSYDHGAWHVIALNSNLSLKAGSAQAAWLESDLEANVRPCTMAYWHHPLFSSGPNGNNAAVRDAWAVLHRYGTELVVNGHDHLYERFAPQDPTGRADPAHGIRQFTSGTGGAYLTPPVRLQPNSEVQGVTWGVLKLTLRERSYDWEFVGIPGSRFTDSGSAACH